MTIHIRDLDEPTRPGAWRALALTVTGKERPGLALHACHPRALRISVLDAPVLFARVEPEHYGYHTLRVRETSLGVLPAIPFPLIDELHGSGPATPRDWARAFAKMLQHSEASPLYAGAWTLGTSSVPHTPNTLLPALATRIASQPAFAYSDWNQVLDPIALRAPSHPESGRVKAYRKHARAGTLPPVLLGWVSGLFAHVVLDGHDRLLAAALEDVPAPTLYLEATEHPERSDEHKAMITRVLEQETVPTQQANHIALRAFVPDVLAAITRARPLPGGEAAWVAEVRSALTAQGIADPEAWHALEVH